MISTLVKSPDFDCQAICCPSREAWLAQRRSFIGASDTAGIFGVGYADQSPATVWDSKINDRPDDKGNDKRLRIGKLLEPSLRTIFSEETGLPCWEHGPHVIHVHPELPWLGATLDGVTLHDEYGPCVVELKNVSNFNKAEWEGDEPPLKYAVQVAHQLAVTGASHGFLLGLIGGNEPIVKTIERNERFIEAMIQRLEEFWGYVTRQELPPVDESAATMRLLAQIYPQDSGATVSLPPDSSEWDSEFEKAKADKKDAEARELKYGNLFRAAIGEATFGAVPMGPVYSWKTQVEQHKAKEACTVEKRVLRRKA